MADRHELKISITSTGEVKIEVEGITGSKCLSITEDIEKELGIVIDRKNKSEYYIQENTNKINTKID